MATNDSEKDARDVVEAAREAEWKLPSFGKQLFLGDSRLDLIHPQPKLDPKQIDKGERFLTELREVLASRRLRSGAHGSIATPVELAPVDGDITATPVEGGYRVNVRKLWATEGKTGLRPRRLSPGG